MLAPSVGSGTRRVGGTWGVVRERTLTIPGHADPSYDVSSWGPPVDISDVRWTGNVEAFRSQYAEGPYPREWAALIPDADDLDPAMFPFYWHYTLTSSYVNPNLGSFRVAAFRTPGSVEDGNRVMLGAPAVVSESVDGTLRCDASSAAVHAGDLDVFRPSDGVTYRAQALSTEFGPSVTAFVTGGTAVRLRTREVPLGWAVTGK